MVSNYHCQTMTIHDAQAVSVDLCKHGCKLCTPCVQNIQEGETLNPYEKSIKNSRSNVRAPSKCGGEGECLLHQVEAKMKEGNIAFIMAPVSTSQQSSPGAMSRRNSSTKKIPTLPK